MEPPVPPAPAAHPLLDSLPVYLATLAIQGHARALHVAKVDERTVGDARAQYPALDKACRDVLRDRERREALRKPLTPVRPLSMPASAADLCAFVGNSNGKLAFLHADIGTLLRLITLIVEHFGVENLDGLSIYDWFNREHRAQLERDVLALGDTDPAAAEYLQAQVDRARGHAGPSSIVEPPEA